jgi:hypothetical protein
MFKRQASAAIRIYPDLEYGMGLIETTAALAVCLLALVIAVALDRRPYRPGKRNYIMLMILALAAALVLARHLLTLIL